MRGKRASEVDVNHLRDTWVANPDASRAKVHEKFERRYGKGIIGVRKAQQLIPTFSQSPSGEPIPPFEYVEWEPWRNKQRSPETSAFLLTMGAVCMAVQKRRLHDHEAKWAMRLRVALEGLMPYDQFCFVSLYAMRTVGAYYSEPECPFTADLDAILAYKPWLPENAHAYGVLACTSLVPKPQRGSRAELSDEDAGVNLLTGKAWETLRVDLRPPWYMDPEDLKPYPFLAYFYSAVASRRELAQERKDFTPQEWEYRARDTALQFWMGDNPIFEKPQLHGSFGLIRPDDMEVPEESNTNGEVDQ